MTSKSTASCIIEIKKTLRVFKMMRLFYPLWAAAPSAELLWKLLSTPQE
jgi:hypothetical protein